MNVQRSKERACLRIIRNRGNAACRLLHVVIHQSSSDTYEPIDNVSAVTLPPPSQDMLAMENARRDRFLGH